MGQLMSLSILLISNLNHCCHGIRRVVTANHVLMISLDSLHLYKCVCSVYLNMDSWNILNYETITIKSFHINVMEITEIYA